MKYSNSKKFNWKPSPATLRIESVRRSLEHPTPGVNMSPFRVYSYLLNCRTGEFIDINGNSICRTTDFSPAIYTKGPRIWGNSLVDLMSPDEGVRREPSRKNTPSAEQDRVRRDALLFTTSDATRILQFNATSRRFRFVLRARTLTLRWSFLVYDTLQNLVISIRVLLCSFLVFSLLELLKVQLIFH